MDPAPLTPATTEVDALLARMRGDLTEAMRARDKVRVGAIRTALAAIANAEAPPVVAAPSSADAPVVGRLEEHARLELTAEDADRILRDEIADRADTAEQFEAHGRADEAATVRIQMAVLAAYLT